MSDILTVEKLSCGYNGHIVLKGITTAISDNQFVGIIGPNGSGKTTFLKSITKVIPPAEGKIRISGTDIGSLSHKELARIIAVVSQSHTTELLLTVEEFVLFGRIPHREKWQFFETKKDIETAKKAMAFTGVLAKKDHYMDNLSGGERQLAFIARSLAQTPRLLLLDEPTNHLDIGHQIKIMDMLYRLSKEGNHTVMMVLHDLNLASQYCDKLILVHNGTIHCEGAPEEVITYRNVEEVYKTVVVTSKNPVSSKPCLFLVPERERKEGKCHG